MLPLVFKTANANGVTDYINGLDPDIPLDEDYANLGTLGDASEPLFQAALNDIFPPPVSPPPTRGPILEEVSERKANSPLYQIMVAD